MSQEVSHTETEGTAEAIEVIDQEKAAAEAAKKIVEEIALAAKKAAEEIAAKKAQLEAIAKKFTYSINADTLARSVSAHEQSRLKSKSKLPPDQIQAKFQAYLEQRIGVKMNIRPVQITNIRTMNGELKMIEGNNTKQLTDDMTLYVDQDAVAQLQMNTSDFRTDKKIAYLGTDPTLSLEERLKQQEIVAEEAAKKATEVQDEEWGEITHIRKIGAGAISALEDIPDLVVSTPTKTG